VSLFSKNSSTCSRKDFFKGALIASSLVDFVACGLSNIGSTFFDSSLICLISSFFTSQAFGTFSGSFSGFGSFGSGFIGSCFSSLISSLGSFTSGSSSGSGVFSGGDNSLLISSSGVNVYFHIIFSLNLNGVAKSFMFRSATRVAGVSVSSVISFISFNLRYASFSTDFRLSV